jgi:hypothetical protein
MSDGLPTTLNDARPFAATNSLKRTLIASVAEGKKSPRRL